MQGDVDEHKSGQDAALLRVILMLIVSAVVGFRVGDIVGDTDFLVGALVQLACVYIEQTLSIVPSHEGVKQFSQSVAEFPPLSVRVTAV